MGVIYIGLGGTGVKIIENIKGKLSGRPNVGFLGVDIGEQDRGGVLTEGEFTNLDEGNIEEIVENFPIHNWWPSKEFSRDYDLVQGAYQFRLIGRMALYYMGERVTKALGGTVNNIGDANNDFIVISSAGGGFGAGTFGDMPGVIGEIMGAGNFNVYGYLLFSDILQSYYSLNQKEINRVMYNAHSLFDELNIASCYSGDEKLNFDIRNVGKITLRKYDHLFSMFYNNKSGHYLDSRDDYIDASSNILKNLYYVSIQSRAFDDENTRSFSGIENLLASIGFSEKTNFKVNVDGEVYRTPIEYGANFGSFAYFDLYFPENDVLKYLRYKYFHNLAQRALEEHLEDEILKDKVDGLLKEIRESQDRDELVTKAELSFREKAKELNKPIWNHSNVEETIKKNFFSYVDKRKIKELSRMVNIYIDDVDIIVEKMREGFKEKIDDLREQKEGKINEVYSNSKYNPAKRKDILESLKDKIGGEKDDFKNNEKQFLGNYEKKYIKDSIMNQVNELMKIRKEAGIWSKLFGEKELKRQEQAKANVIANKLIGMYKKYRIYEVIVYKIMDFYEKLERNLDDKIGKIDKVMDELEKNLKSKKESVLGGLQPVEASPGCDLTIKIANSRYIIDDKIVNNTEVKPEYTEDIDNIINTIKEKADRLARENIQNITLQKALEWEAEYFLNDLEVSVGMQARTFNGFLDILSNSTEEEFVKFQEKWRDYYDNSILGGLKREFEENKGDINESSFVRKLVEARITAAWMRWKEAFYSRMETHPNLPGLIEEEYLAAFLLHDDEKNQELKESFADKTRTIRRKKGIDVQLDGASYNSLEYVLFTFSPTLPQMSKLEGDFNQIEKDVINSKLQLYNEESFKSPDENRYYYRDKRFYEIPEFTFTRLVPPVLNQEKVEDIWKGILLLLSLDYFKVEDRKLKLIKDIQTSKRPILYSPTTIGKLDNLFKFWIFVYDYSSEIRKYLEEELQKVDDIEETLNEGLDTLSEIDTENISRRFKPILERYIEEKAS